MSAAASDRLAAGGTEDTSAHERPAPVDVAAVIANNGLRGWPLLAVALLACALVFDGFDLVLLGFVAPAVSAHFELSTVQLGLILALQQAGIAAGGLIGGWLGDRLGRRILLWSSIGFFGIGTLLTSIAPTATLFMLFRIVSGLGLGAVSPNIAAYMMEVLPARSRGQLTVLAFAALGVGSTLCALVAKFLLPLIGWQGMFLIGGLLPLMLIPAVLWLLPESPVFLVASARSNREVAAALNRICRRQSFTPERSFVRPERQTQNRAHLTELFAHGLLRETLALWCIILTLQFASVAIVNMGTTLITAMGLELRHAIDVMFAYSTAALAGGLVAAFGIRRFGSRIVLPAFAALASVSLGVAALAAVGGIAHFEMLRALLGITGFAVMGIALAGFSLAANIYPTFVRSTGTGLAVAVGRLGSIIGPSIIGLTLVGSGPAYVFGILAAVTTITLGALLVLTRHIPQGAAFAK